jgi:hypothetical protein
MLCVVIACGAVLYRAEAQGVGQSLDVGTEVYWVNYREPGIMEQTGSLTGVTARYSFEQDRSLLRAEARMAAGQVDYSSTDTGAINGIDDFIVELRGIVGFDPFVSGAGQQETFFCYLYTGAGYRYLEDDSGGMVSSNGYGGYRRQSHYLYSPIGLEVGRRFDPSQGEKGGLRSLVFAVEYDVFWQGLQASYLSDVDPSFSDPRNRQRQGYGARARIGLAYDVNGYTVVFEPFVRYWNIERSEDQDIYYAGGIWGYGYEPANRTLETGIALAVKF